jgi:RHS repeat-associated protein
MTDASGTVVAQSGHFPYGEQWYATGSSAKWVFTTYQRDFNSGNALVASRLRFRDDYARARYYASRLGRFSSPDPLGGTPSDPQSFDAYAYGRNDAVNLVDPSGLSWNCSTYSVGSGGSSYTVTECTWQD